MPADYAISLPEFDGPLDLLLHLIERQELDITAISLAAVTEQYLAQVEALRENRLEQLIDFLVIGARLLVIKSRALLPRPPLLPAEEDEEDPAEALLRQLRQYKRFKQAALWLAQRQEAGWRTYLRVAPPPQIEKQLDLSGLSVSSLAEALLSVFHEAELMAESVTLVQPRQISVEDQVELLRRRLAAVGRLQFRDLLSPRADRVEVAVTLLAVLESIKRHEIVVHQPVAFGPVELVAAPQTVAAAPAPVA